MISKRLWLITTAIAAIVLWQLIIGGAEGVFLSGGFFGRISAQVGTFLGLSDTPDDYTGQALKQVRVNAGETALEFVDPAAVASYANVKAVADSNITLANPGTAVFDGVTLSATNRLLLTAQTDLTENGIYVFDTSSTPLVRSTDANQDAEFASAFQVGVDAGGSNYGNSLWQFNYTGPVTLETSLLQFVQISSSLTNFFTGGQLKPGAFATIQVQSPLAVSGQISSSTTVVLVSGSGGPITLTTGNPRILAGTRNGQVVWIGSLEATNTLTMPTGQGVQTCGSASQTFALGGGFTPFVWVSANSIWYQATCLDLRTISSLAGGRIIYGTVAAPLIVGDPADIANGDYLAIYTDAGVSKLVAYCSSSPCTDPIIITDLHITGTLEVDGAALFNGAITVPQYQVRVFRTTSLTVADDTSTPIPFTSESNDTDNMHDNSSNNTRITINTTGAYLLNCNFEWAGGSGGSYRQMVFRKNGTTSIASDLKEPSAAELSNNLTLVHNFVATDYVEVMAYQDSTGNLDINYTADYSPFCEARRL